MICPYTQTHTTTEVRNEFWHVVKLQFEHRQFIGRDLRAFPSERLEHYRPLQSVPVKTATQKKIHCNIRSAISLNFWCWMFLFFVYVCLVVVCDCSTEMTTLILTYFVHTCELVHDCGELKANIKLFVSVNVCFLFWTNLVYIIYFITF